MATINSTSTENAVITGACYEQFIEKFQAVDLMMNGMLRLCERGEGLAQMDVSAMKGVFDPLYADFIKLGEGCWGHE